MLEAPTVRDLKLDACVAYANANFKTSSLRVPELAPVLKVFRYNVSRARNLMLTPAIIGHTAMEFQRHFDLASLDVDGTLENTIDPTAGVTAGVGQRTLELHNANLERNAALIGTPAWDQFVFKSHKIGSIPVEMLSRAPNGYASFEPILSAIVIASWTAFESLTGDLWEAALNLNPSGLAHLKGSAARLKKGSPLGTPKAKREDSQSKVVELNLIQFYQFDLRSKMGTILRRRYEFSRLSSIREAYSLAFDSDSTQVDAALKDDSLDTLSTVRNLLVHKAAIVDEDYLYRAKGLKGLPNGKLGKLLLLDGETVVKLVKPALAQGARLLEAVDGWLHKHKS